MTVENLAEKREMVNSEDFEFHEIASIFPLIEGPEFSDLVQSVKANGVKEPIWLYEGKILDGRNRYRAANEAGIPFQTKEFTGSQIEAIDHVWALNRTRRHLTSSQAAIADAKRNKMEDTYAEIRESARERQDQTNKLKRNEKGQLQPVQELTPEQEQPGSQTRDIRAKAAGTNSKYIDLADRLVEERPDLAEEVHAGKKTLTQVQRELKKEELSGRLISQPSGKYRVIYADPPWHYNDKCDEGSVQSGGCEKHYPSMKIPELCALPVKDMAEENAVLFLWTTSPLLEESFKVINAWDFSYRASMVWDKVRHNMGHYVSVRHEFLLICVRGSCTPDVKKLFDSVQSIERAQHSAKPEEFRNIIDTIYPHGKRIELFRRGDAPSGWEAWGNEVQVA